MDALEMKCFWFLNQGVTFLLALQALFILVLGPSHGLKGVRSMDLFLTTLFFLVKTLIWRKNRF